MRNWKVQKRWKAPLKHDVVGVKMSRTIPGLVYVAGLDNKVMCGPLDCEDKEAKTKANREKGEKRKALMIGSRQRRAAAACTSVSGCLDECGPLWRDAWRLEGGRTLRVECTE